MKYLIISFASSNRWCAAYLSICAISLNKVVSVRIIKKSANKKDFLNFLKIDLHNIKNNYILIDNARIHHSKLIKDFIKTSTNKLLFNVPYHPEFNPIEKIFSKIKTIVRFKKNNFIDNKLIRNIKNAFNKITENNLKNCFNKSLRLFK